jgi:2-phospho-L-lactate guanylyltransferase
MLLVRDVAVVRPQFGSDSYYAHRAAGAADVTAAAAAGARRDVDTLSDLRAAAALGVGPATTAVLPRTL